MAMKWKEEEGVGVRSFDTQANNNNYGEWGIYQKDSNCSKLARLFLGDVSV